MKLAGAKRLWWCIAALGFVARLGFALYAQSHVDQSLLDVQTYTRIAGNMLQGYGFSLVAPYPTVFVAPLYPAVLAAVRLLTGHFWPAFLLQALLWVAAARLIWALGTHLFGQAVGFVGSALVLLHPELIAISGFLYAETVFVFLLYLSLLFAAMGTTEAGERGKGISSWLFSGVCLGLATLTRPVTLYFAPLLSLVPLGFVRGPLRRRAVAGIAAFVSFLVVVSPWTVRNYLRFRAFVPVATGGGIALWIGNYQPFDGEYRYEKTRNLMAELTQGMNEVEADRHLTKLALEQIRREPVQASLLFVKKLFRYWFRTYEKVPDGKPRSFTPLGYALLIVHLVVLALALYGAVSNLGRWRMWIPFLALVAYMTGIHTLSLPVPRYRLPLLPGILVFTAAGMLEVAKRFVAQWIEDLEKSAN